MDTTLLKTAITKAGGPAAVGRHFGISWQAVSAWRECPARRVMGLEALSGIPRSELRPDLYPPEREVA